jgi:Ca2+/Na+ antiporter
MLGSMLTNMLLVFGVACLIGGTRWQVQELRITSGNVSVVMLLVATAGSLFPAALVLSGQLPNRNDNHDVAYIPSQEEITFCRVNASVMFFLYLCYLVFQLGTHKEEFDDDAMVVPASRRARRNLFCLRLMGQARTAYTGDHADFAGQELPMLRPSDQKARLSDRRLKDDDSLASITSDDDRDKHYDEEEDLIASGDSDNGAAQDESRRRRRRKLAMGNGSPLKAIDRVPPSSPRRAKAGRHKSKNSDARDDDDGDDYNNNFHEHVQATQYHSKCEDRNEMHAEDKIRCHISHTALFSVLKCTYIYSWSFNIDASRNILAFCYYLVHICHE